MEEDPAQGDATEVYRGPLHLRTPHHQEMYPQELQVVRPTPGWAYSVIVPRDGQGFTALGGERAVGYMLEHGAVAAGFELHPGDRARRVRSDLPHSLAEWHIERR